MSENLAIYALVGSVGLAIGSFLNVCIHRIPLGLSVIWPRSACPSCSQAIAWKDNIPLVSFFILEGKCRGCRQPISVQYPLVEIMNALGFVALVMKFGLCWEALVYALFFSALLTITWIDLYHQIIPDVISLPGILFGLLCAWTILPLDIMDSLIGVLVGGGILWGLAALSPLLFGKEGLGGGDIKLLAMMGAFLGWQGALLSLMIAAIVGSVVGVTLIVLKFMSRSQYLPFGPFLALGAIIALFFQAEIMEWYLGGH